jgi:hypothetical protein
MDKCLDSTQFILILNMFPSETLGDTFLCGFNTVLNWNVRKVYLKCKEKIAGMENRKQVT